MGAQFWEYWYFEVPDLVLTALIYLMLLRTLLGLAIPDRWPNPVWQAFRRFNAPVLAAVACVTPRSVPPVLLALFATMWLVLLRSGFVIAMAGLGWAPGLEDQAG